MMDESEKEDIKSKAYKDPWPLWKQFAVAGLAIVIIVPLIVGVIVTVTHKGSGSDSTTTHLWQPKAGDSWQIVLQKPISIASNGKVTPDVRVYDLDMYDNEVSTFQALQKKGKHVICYFSAGSWENWRDDKDDFHKTDIGKVMDGWPDENWLDTRTTNVRKIMKKRIAYAASKGCDAIDPDNIDGYQNENGVGLSKADAIDYVKFLSKTAASYNMSTGLKNAGGIISDVLDHVHFSVNEQCSEYSECAEFAPFIKAGKPVFHIEYPDGAPNSMSTKTVDSICSNSGNATGSDGFSTVIKKMNLDGWVEYCTDKKSYVTDLDTTATD